MKTLFINRHAKSLWPQRNTPDFDRPLNHRGLRDAPFMAKALKLRNEQVDAIVSSPATRALTTAQLFALELGIDAQEIHQDERIYEASVENLSKVVEQLDENWNSVIMFGHNPGFGNLVEYYTGEYVEMPTSAIAKVTFEFDKWKEAFRGNGTLEFFDYPKNYKELS